MPNVIKACEVQSGQMKAVDLYGVAVAIAHVDGAFYAFSDTCPHAACSLSKGVVAGKVVTCSSDGSQFDLTNGQVLTGPAATRVRTYRVQLEGEELRI